ELIHHFSNEIKKNDIEVTIACHEIELRVLNHESLPEQWAAIQSNLAMVYRSRLQGKRAENLENAIICYEKALKIFTRDSFPERWAIIQSNLANAYSERIYGDPAENLECAVTCNTKSLRVFTYQDFPENWAMTHFNLAVAHRDRLSGSQEENLQYALICCQEALCVYNCEDHPEQWAKVQAMMANINSRMGGVDNLEDAILGYKRALQVYQRDAFPREWAETQCLLGISYSNRLQGDRAKNIENAIDCYESALQVLTRATFPEDWARTQNNLAVIYQNKLYGNSQDNLEYSIKLFQNALLIYQYGNYPKFYTETLLNLGISYKKSGDFLASYSNFAESIKGAEFLREEIISGDNIKQKIAENYHQIYQHIVEVSLKLNKSIEAIEYVERSKTQNLVELILARELKNIFPSQAVNQLEKFQKEIDSTQYQLQNSTVDNPSALVQHLQQLRQQRNELQDKYLSIGSSFKFDPFRLTLDEGTAIIEFFVTEEKLLVFIVTRHHQQPIILPPDLINFKKLVNWGNSYLRAYKSKSSHWQRRLSTRLQILGKILHIDKIIRQIPKECDCLIFIPHRFLHLFPLHALPLGNSYLTERFHRGISYAPSCQLLQLSQARKRPDFTNLFAVQNPTDDLPYTDIEIKAIQNYFNSVNVLKKTNATLEAIDNASLDTTHCLHFSCHAYFNLRNTQNSALILANAYLDQLPARIDLEEHFSLANHQTLNTEQCLTLQKIFGLKLEQCRLVILSACETGLIDFNNISDEYIGLPSGFLFAGCTNVVSSLWAVNDLSTAFLMIKFYQNHKQENLSVTKSLNEAQKWLRDITKLELQTWIKENKLPISPVEKMSLRRRLRKLTDDDHPFNEPYYWAAFCAI
ncbi:MAG: CHAT domain-containing protein, partial [Xenococcus sp. (in: cyanobacteria)]